MFSTAKDQQAVQKAQRIHAFCENEGLYDILDQFKQIMLDSILDVSAKDKDMIWNLRCAAEMPEIFKAGIKKMIEDGKVSAATLKQVKKGKG